jgi:preprotein translocase subunit YajC
MHLNSLNVILAQAPASGGQGSPMGLIVPMGLMLIIVYFMMIRPQQQRAKQQAQLLEKLKNGDRVLTSAGIVGVVVGIKEKATPPVVSIRSADSKFEVLKSSVTDILEASSTTES